LTSIGDCIKAKLFRTVNLRVDLPDRTHCPRLGAEEPVLQGRLSLDQYVDDSLDILLGGILTPSGEKRDATRKRRSA
jgi:hypothetical protein